MSFWDPLYRYSIPKGETACDRSHTGTSTEHRTPNYEFAKVTAQAQYPGYRVSACTRLI
jgi:hypothetical protein